MTLEYNNKKKTHTAIVLIGMYPKDTSIVIQRGTCTLIVIVAKSTIAQI